MGKKYIIGLDQSTSGTKIVLVDEAGEISYKKSKSHEQFYPQPGWVEHDPIEIYDNCVELLNALNRETFVSLDEIIGLAITNQRETIVLWDRETKKPLYNAIVWQCRRSTEICQQMKQEGHAKSIEEKTGLQLDPYFSASKIKWALENVPAVQKSAQAGTLMIGTIDSWLIFKLTDGEVHRTDHTNASRTMLYNITTHDWDEGLLDLFGVKRSMLPEILSSNAVYGVTNPSILGRTLKIAGVIGDSQGALFGQQCFESGMAKATYGTGSSLLLYIGKDQIRSDKGILTSVAWGIDGEIEYALEGVINSSGDTLKWVKDNLGLYETDDEVETYIHSVDSCEGVYIIPAFVGLGAPYWKPEAKASIVGMTRKTNKAHLIRAAVESMAYQVADLIDLMEKESRQVVKALNVDGGPTQNDFLMQFQSDLLQADIVCSAYQELSVLGAVYLGGLGLGLWESKSKLKALKKQSKVYSPKMDESQSVKRIHQWQQNVAYYSSAEF